LDEGVLLTFYWTILRKEWENTSQGGDFPKGFTFFHFPFDFWPSGFWRLSPDLILTPGIHWVKRHWFGELDLFRAHFFFHIGP